MCIVYLYIMLIKVKHQAFEWYVVCISKRWNDEMTWRNPKREKTKDLIVPNGEWWTPFKNANNESEHFVFCTLCSTLFWKYINNIMQFEMLHERNQTKPYIWMVLFIGLTLAPNVLTWIHQQNNLNSQTSERNTFCGFIKWIFIEDIECSAKIKAFD